MIVIKSIMKYSIREIQPKYVKFKLFLFHYKCNFTLNREQLISTAPMNTSNLHVELDTDALWRMLTRFEQMLMNATERQLQTWSKTFVSGKETFESTRHVVTFLSSAEQKS